MAAAPELASAEAASLVHLADFFNAFSLVLLVGYSRMSERRARLPGLFLVLLCLEGLSASAGLLYPGSHHVNVVVDAVRGVSPQARSSPFMLAAYLVRNLKAAYEITVALGTLLVALSMGMHAVQTLVATLFFGRSEEADKLEERIREVERQKREQAEQEKAATLPKKDAKGSAAPGKKGKKAAASGSSRGEGGDGAQTSAATVPTDTDEPVGGAVSLVLFAVGVLAIAATGRSWLSLPKAAKPSTLTHVLQLFPKCLPARHGLLSLLGTIVLARRRGVWLETKADGSRKATAAGHALLFRLLSLLCFASAWVFDCNGDFVDYFDRSSVPKQTHMIVVALHLVAMSVGYCVAFASWHPLLFFSMFNVFPVLLSLVANPLWAGLKLSDVNSYLALLTATTLAMSMFFGGPTSVAVTVITASALTQLHGELLLR